MSSIRAVSDEEDECFGYGASGNAAHAENRIRPHRAPRLSGKSANPIALGSRDVDLTLQEDPPAVPQSEVTEADLLEALEAPATPVGQAPATRGKMMLSGLVSGRVAEFA